MVCFLKLRYKKKSQEFFFLIENVVLYNSVLTTHHRTFIKNFIVTPFFKLYKFVLMIEYTIAYIKKSEFLIN